MLMTSIGMSIQYFYYKICAYLSWNNFKIWVLHNYNKRILVELVPNETLILVKTAYRWPFGQNSTR